MSWPIGYPKCELGCRQDPERGLIAGDVAVTTPEGWMELPLPGELGAHACPHGLFVRLRLTADANGLPFLYGEEVRLGSKLYRSIHALAMAEGGGWIAYLARVIPVEIAGRAKLGRSLLAPRPAFAETMPRLERITPDDTAPRAAVRDDPWS